MIGRVLREPGAQATGLPALDECYVYCGEFATITLDIATGDVRDELRERKITWGDDHV